MSLSVRAYRSDGAADEFVSDAAFARSHISIRFTLAQGTVMSGDCAVTRLQWGGGADGLEEMVFQLESAGDFTI